jgi:DNA-binding NarL/FixJ family response regulator
VPLTYLVVDDEPLIVQRLERIARPYGQVLAAATLREAEAVIRGHSRLAGMILDVGLPDGSGLDLLRKLRSKGVDTPTLVLSGGIDADVVNAAFALGADILGKPWPKGGIERFFEGASGTEELHIPIEEGVSRAVRKERAACRLSQAEADVLKRACLGETPMEIALARETSELTVNTQIRNLLRLTRDPSLAAAVGRILRGLASN